MIIFLFTGPSGVGKSTIARHLRESFKIPVIRERKIIHRLAKSHRFNRGREWLEAVGMEPILDEVLRETVREIKETRARGVILDGSYDRRLPGVLEEEVEASKVLIISILADEAKREARISERLGIDINEARREMNWIDFWKKEAGMEEIMTRADIIIGNNGPLDEVVRELQPRLEFELFSPWLNLERARG